MNSGAHSLIMRTQERAIMGKKGLLLTKNRMMRMLNELEQIFWKEYSN
jgi:hypothetical protein